MENRKQKGTERTVTLLRRRGGVGIGKKIEKIKNSVLIAEAVTVSGALARATRGNKLEFHSRTSLLQGFSLFLFFSCGGLVAIGCCLFLFS